MFLYKKNIHLIFMQLNHNIQNLAKNYQILFLNGAPKTKFNYKKIIQMLEWEGNYNDYVLKRWFLAHVHMHKTSL